mmetsp:Transcript_28967/g.54429  ORF Transcript_28967/g.54429 Transcript_28967/m.54429 type:complete len:227 (+) Transcript_28967:1095-1775(+)
MVHLFHDTFLAKHAVRLIVVDQFTFVLNLHGICSIRFGIPCQPYLSKGSSPQQTNSFQLFLCKVWIHVGTPTVVLPETQRIVQNIRNILQGQDPSLHVLISNDVYIVLCNDKIILEVLFGHVNSSIRGETLASSVVLGSTRQSPFFFLFLFELVRKNECFSTKSKHFRRTNRLDLFAFALELYRPLLNEVQLRCHRLSSFCNHGSFWNCDVLKFLRHQFNFNSVHV